MRHLLKIEWLKIKNYRTFWILSGLFLLSIFGINYIAFEIQENIYQSQQGKGIANMVLGNPPYSFPSVWQAAAYISSFLLFIPGLMMIISITNEYSYKTHRQNIIDGLSRKQFIEVKLFLTVIIAFFSTLMVFLTALVFGWMDGSQSLSFENFQYIGYFFIQALSYSCMALLIGVLFKRSGISIGVYFLYAVVLENLAAALMNHYLNYSGRFLPLETTDNLIPNPLLRKAPAQFTPQANIYVLLAVAAVYLLLYFFGIKRKFETDDL